MLSTNYLIVFFFFFIPLEHNFTPEKLIQRWKWSKNWSTYTLFHSMGRKPMMDQQGCQKTLNRGWKLSQWRDTSKIDASSQTGERGCEESRGARCSGCGFKRAVSLEKPEPKLQSFPFTQDQPGCINGSGSKSTDGWSYFAVLILCAPTTQHTSAHASLWCNADVYTLVLLLVLLHATSLIINSGSNQTTFSWNCEQFRLCLF